MFKHHIVKLELNINENKSKCMIFRNKKSLPDSLKNNITLEIVEKFNYLGHILNYNLDDVEAKLNKFYGSSNSVFRNSYKVDIETFLFLFNSYCAPQYGLSLWCSKNIFIKQSFRAFHIAFSKSLKIIVGCPVYSSSHIVAEICHQLLLNHRVIQNQVKYLNRLIKSNHEIVILNSYFVN